MLTKTLSVSAIQQGTVIDHITAGCAFKIVSLLRLEMVGTSVTLGANLLSDSLVRKDIIKIEDHELTCDEANKVAIFAPDATISIIEEYRVQKKFKVSIPKILDNAFPCPNARCITNHEPMGTRFIITSSHQNMLLHCDYCEKTFPQHALNPKLSP